MISPLGERIKYLPKPVGPCAEDTFAPKRWSLTKNVNACDCEADLLDRIIHLDKQCYCTKHIMKL
jgi:hypothetical protein